MRAGLLRGAALIVLGLILGASLTNLYIGRQLDNLSLANRSLREDLAYTRQQLQKMKEAAEIKRRHAISEVETFLILDSRENLTDYDRIAVELEAGKIVKEWLNPIIGQEVAGLDSLLIPRILDNRQIEANGNRYRLTTQLVVVNRKTSVYIRATRVKTGGPLN